MAAQKFTRKELKKDAFVTNVERSLAFIQQNATTIGVLLLIVIVILVGGTYLRKSQRAAQQEASYLLYLGQNLLSQGDYQLAIAPLEQCIEKHGRTDFSRYARVGLVQGLLGLGDPQTALARSEVYRKELPAKHPAAQQLTHLHAVALADAGRYDEAADMLATMITSDLPDQAYYSLTLRRSHWLEAAGRPQESLAILTALQTAIAAGTLQLANAGNELEQRLEVVRALAR